MPRPCEFPARETGPHFFYRLWKRHRWQTLAILCEKWWTGENKFPDVPEFKENRLLSATPFHYDNVVYAFRIIRP